MLSEGVCDSRCHIAALMCFPDDLWCCVSCLFLDLLCIFFGALSITVLAHGGGVRWGSCLSWVLRVLHLVSCKPFVRCAWCKYLLPVCGLPFYFLNSVFGGTEVLKFDGVYFLFFPLFWLVFWVFIIFAYCKVVKIFFYNFSWKFYSFTSMIHFRLIFMHSKGKGWGSFYISTWISSLTSTIYLLKRISSPFPLKFLSTF